MERLRVRGTHAERRPCRHSGADYAAGRATDRPNLADRDVQDPEWVFDVKYDGFRAVYFLEQRRGHLVSRGGNSMTHFDEIGDQLAALLNVDDAILGGEVISVDQTGRPQFYDLLRRTGMPSYVAFDHRPAAVAAQRASTAPAQYCSKGSACRTEALSVTGRGCELFDLMCTHDLEGIVAKRLTDPYDPRVRWLKVKNPDYSQKEGRAELFDKSSR